jgi:hypothetical protein
MGVYQSKELAVETWTRGVKEQLAMLLKRLAPRLV